MCERVLAWVTLDTSCDHAYGSKVSRRRATAGARATTALVVSVLFTSRAGAAIDPPELRLQTAFVQYGAALAAELVAAPGAICPATSTSPCIIGSGGGLALRVGYRFHAPWYLGAAYEFSKQDAHKAMHVAILQQLRGESRYYLPVRGAYVPFATAGAGAVAYGSQFGIATFGGMVFVGAGVEIQLSPTSVVALMASYRPIVLTNWEDTTRAQRPTGLLSMIGLEVSLEQRVPTYQPAAP